MPPISGVAAEMEPSEMMVPSQTSGAMDIDPAIPSTPTVDAVVRSTETLGPSETFGTIGVDSTVPANPTIPITANPPQPDIFHSAPSHVHSIDLIAALMSLPEEPIPTSTWCFISLALISKQAALLDFLTAYCSFGAIGTCLAIEYGRKLCTMRLIGKLHAQAEALVQAYQDNSFQDGVPSITTACMTCSESIDKYNSTVDLEYITLVLSTCRSATE
ncbi:hypothetical protein BS47DRAFT_1367077 [Hydnum rufescens UP504]|uniref:Uncharacterized protein n=1 Tax=Hydnum rufescens UP504 TaxID=1448309 RepID=A0A9P6AJ90_9AGAM|nr:hypothetical protein BS47DRAFT_1367077 [Hydnum rufescens UP504]